jgi:hypothetical protein
MARRRENARKARYYRPVDQQYFAMNRVLKKMLFMSAAVKVFGCRPLANDCHEHGRPASENLQWRKPREMRCDGSARYGDLSAGDDEAGGWLSDAIAWKVATSRTGE